jgi:hypothetical protein
MIATASVSGSAAEAAGCDFTGAEIAIPSTLPEDIGFSLERKIDYALQHMGYGTDENAKPRRRRSRWVLLLLLPYLGLCFPQIYARSTPALWGFPFFYWYQFAWVIAASGLLAIVYRKLKT